jgi:hypothetical protein
MRRLVLLTSLLAAAPAIAETDFFWPHPLENCRMYPVRGKTLEFCALSTPQGERARVFSLTARDPSQLDTKSKAYKDLAKAKHRLVAEEKLPVEAGEYLDYRMTTVLNLPDDAAWLITVPLVKGTPEDYDEARALLYLFDGAKFRLVHTSEACAPKCKGQTVQTLGKAGSKERAVTFIQTLPETTRRVEFTWDGKKLTSK